MVDTNATIQINSYHANTDETFAPTFLKVFRAYVGENRPIFTGVDVAKLLRPELHFEVEVQAFLPARTGVAQ